MSQSVPHLPHKVKVDVSRCHACHAKWRLMSPSATPATQTAAATTAPNGTQARHQSQPRAVSATPATQSACRCRRVPRLPHKVKVDVTAMSPSATPAYACHTNSRGDNGVKRDPCAPPEPAQCNKCLANPNQLLQSLAAKSFSAEVKPGVHGSMVWSIVVVQLARASCNARKQCIKKHTDTHTQKHGVSVPLTANVQYSQTPMVLFPRHQSHSIPGVRKLRHFLPVPAFQGHSRARARVSRCRVCLLCIQLPIVKWCGQRPSRKAGTYRQTHRTVQWSKGKLWMPACGQHPLGGTGPTQCTLHLLPVQLSGNNSPHWCFHVVQMRLL